MKISSRLINYKHYRVKEHATPKWGLEQTGWASDGSSFDLNIDIDKRRYRIELTRNEYKKLIKTAFEQLDETRE